MLTAIRDAFAGLGRAVLRLPEPVVADTPLPDPLREEMDELARAREQRRADAWIADCEARGDWEEDACVYDMSTGRVIDVLRHYPRMPKNWRPAHAPAR